MAIEVYQYSPTVPAGTAAAAPYRMALAMPERKIESIYARIPPGPNGLLGWAIYSSGTQVVPVIPGTWMVADNESFTWQLASLPTSGDWTFVGYNLGLHPHTVSLQFVVDLPEAVSAAVQPAPIPYTDISVG